MARAALVAQAAHIPVHLGSARGAVEATVAALDLEPGDIALLNDPFAGGTHLPDLTMVRPVFLTAGEPDFFAVSLAHHADVGGATPGSMGVATDLLAEGLVLPPVKVRSRGEPVADVLRLIAANVRGAAERMADLAAQEASLVLAERRLRALVEQHGHAMVRDYAGHLMDYSQRLVGAVLGEMPAGTYRAVDSIADDGVGGGPFPIRLALTLSGEGAEFDFRGTAGQARGGVNANPSIALAACVYAVRCLCPARLPTNDGVFRCITLRTERGSLIDPVAPAPVAGGNVETSQRLVDVALRALARACPGVVPAASAGTMSNLSIGGLAARRQAEWAFYETLPGGAGAGPFGGGTSGVQTHMTNTANTPVEELERRYPVRVCRLTLRRGSGGRGRFRGGCGIVKELEFEVDASLSLFAERHVDGPRGLGGGGAGAAGRAVLVRGGRRQRIAPKSTHEVRRGDRLVVETPGGGGWGRG